MTRTDSTWLTAQTKSFGPVSIRFSCQPTEGDSSSIRKLSHKHPWCMWHGRHQPPPLVHSLQNNQTVVECADDYPPDITNNQIGHEYDMYRMDYQQWPLEKYLSWTQRCAFLGMGRHTTTYLRILLPCHGWPAGAYGWRLMDTAR